MNKLTYVAVAVLALLLFSRTIFYTVEPDEEAVILRLGKYIGTFPPGLHFKLPLGIDESITVKTRLRLQQEFGFRTKNISGRHTTYETDPYKDESLMLTGDLNVANVHWVVQFRIAEPKKYLFHTKNPSQNLQDISESVMRRVVGDRTVGAVLTTGRAAVEEDALKLTQMIINKYDMGIQIITVKLQSVDPPEEVKASFNEVNAAKQEQESAINQAEKEYNRVIPREIGRAEKSITTAEGYAISVVNRARGDAEKLRKTWLAYRKAPKITKNRMFLETMEEVLGRVGKLIILDPKLKGIMPLYDSMPNNLLKSSKEIIEANKQKARE